MRQATEALRDHIGRVLDWEDAHVGFDKAVDGIPPAKRGAVAAGFDHSPWQLVEHIRIAQEDIVDFCVNPSYEHRLNWPVDYWPSEPAPPDSRSWTKSIASYRRSRDVLTRLAHEVGDLTARVPTGQGNQTYLRAILLAADHTAYHLGQLVVVRRALGI